MTNNNRKNYQTNSILAKERFICNDTWQTGINNNVLVVGPSGSGKTRSYVKPNILQANTSMIISDSKGTLYEETAPLLRRKGYEVYNLDLVSMKGNVGFNPLSHVRYDKEHDCYSEQDIVKISESIIASAISTDPFWDMAGRMYLSGLIAYVLEALPEEEHTLEYVNKVMCANGGKGFEQMMIEHREMYPDSLAVRRYNTYKVMADAEKMSASILGVVSTNLSIFEFKEAVATYNKQPQIDFTTFGKKKTALFLTVSDNDRSLDRLANLFWTQALQGLCVSADKDYAEHRLDVPVRLYLDDFATNVYINDFDKITSNIRSREIYVSIMLQSLSQLEALYGKAKADTIVGNCDQQLVLGIQDTYTAAFFSQRANKPLSAMINMPLDICYLFLRGQKCEITQKFDITTHENYRESCRKNHGLGVENYAEAETENCEF